jgi:hypothetical protein
MGPRAPRPQTSARLNGRVFHIQQHCSHCAIIAGESATPAGRPAGDPGAPTVLLKKSTYYNPGGAPPSTARGSQHGRFLS